MVAEKKQTMRTVAAWVLSILPAAALLASAIGKVMDPQPAPLVESLPHLGYTAETIRAIGYVELFIPILYLIPQTAFLGAILMTGYLGGAIATHVRVGDPFFVQLLIGFVVWVGYALRRPDVVSGAFRRPPR